MGEGGASHEEFHAAPSKKQTRFLEGPVPLKIQGKLNFYHYTTGADVSGAQCR